MQFDLPPAMLALAVVLFAVVVAAHVALGYWVYRDTAARGSDWPILWATGVALPVTNGLLLLAYALVRGRIGERTEPRSRAETLSLTLVLGVLGAFVVGALFSPPDPFTQLLYVGPALLFTLPAAYLYLEGVPGRLHPTA